ncbi:MAG: ComEC/Rec2 family competence protein [Ornithinimicrobium sp.]
MSRLSQGEGQPGVLAPAPDLRLMVPAAIAWALAAFLLGRSRSDLGVAFVIGLLVVIAGAVVAWRTPRHRPGSVSLFALTGLAVVAVTGSALGVDAVHHAGPVSSLATQRAIVEVRGTVLTQPRLVASSGGEQVVLRLRLDQVTARGKSSQVTTPTLVFAPAQWLGVPWRSQVQVRGRLTLPRDLQGSRSGTGDVVAVFSPLGAPVMQRGPPTLLDGADYVRERLRLAVDGVPADARGLIPGLVIGDTSLTPPDLSEAMLDTGMSHLSAVSGSNVAIVLGAVVLACRWIGVPRRWRAPWAAIALVGFVVLCRPEPSVLRAGVMGLIGLAGLSASRRAATVPALAAAILVLLCIDPSLARSYGFALSCVATLGLVVLARPWADAIARRLPARAAVVGEALAIPLAAQVVCAPIIVLLQGDVAVIAVVANLLAAPMVAITTVSGIAVAIGSTVWLPIGVGLAWLAALPALWIAGVARACSSLPFGHIEWLDGAPGAWSLALVTAVVLLALPWLVHHVRRRRLGALAAGAALLTLIMPFPAGHEWLTREELVVVACDVGQGDAFVLPTGSRSAVLVDVGPPGDMVVGCLRDLDIERIDAVVLSHFHDDHVGSLQAVLSEFDVEAAYLSPVLEPAASAERVHSMLRSADVPFRAVQVGEKLLFGPLSATVVWPQLPLVLSADSLANNSSVVLDVRSGSTRLLFTGDIEAFASAHVRQLLRGQHFDVLKVPHHGSADQDRDLVYGTGAALALIGVGQGNTFGHPTSSALALLRQAGMTVARTDRDGDIAVLRTGRGLATVPEER